MREWRTCCWSMSAARVSFSPIAATASANTHGALTVLSTVGNCVPNSHSCYSGRAVNGELSLGISLREHVLIDCPVLHNPEAGGLSLLVGSLSHPICARARTNVWRCMQAHQKSRASKGRTGQRTGLACFGVQSFVVFDAVTRSAPAKAGTHTARRRKAIGLPALAARCVQVLPRCP